MVISILQEDSANSLRGISLELLAEKSVLITGATGLIGTHLLSCLVLMQHSLGMSLTIHAIVHDSIPLHSRMLAETGKIHFHKADLGITGGMINVPQVDYIIHAATYGQPNLFVAQSELTLRLNTIGTFELFSKLRANGKFLFISTSEIYSGLNETIFNETQVGNTTTDHPRSCYIEGKRCGEAICHNFRQKGMDTKIARLSLAYGPGTRLGDNRVLNSIIERGLRNKEIHLLDRGMAERTYCYAADAIHMMWNILLNGTKSTYNVGGVSNTTIAELALESGRLLGVPVIFPKSDQKSLAGAPNNVRLYLTLYESEFGAVNFLPLRSGLERTVSWYRQLLT